VNIFSKGLNFVTVSNVQTTGIAFWNGHVIVGTRWKIKQKNLIQICSPYMILGTSLNKHESPCPKDAPYQISMHSGQWFMRRNFWRFIKIFFFCPLLASPFIWTIRIPIPQACFLPSLVEIGLVVLEKKSFKGKVNRQRQMDWDGNSSPEPSAKKYKHFKNISS